jgi:hypothetical protein
VAISSCHELVGAEGTGRVMTPPQLFAAKYVNASTAPTAPAVFCWKPGEKLCQNLCDPTG